MHVGIDGYIFNAKIKAGIYKSTLNIVKGLAANDKNNQYTVYIPKNDNLFLKSENLSVKRVFCPYFNILKNDPFLIGTWLPISMPLELTFHKIDLYFSTHAILPFRCPCESVITVPDLSYLLDKKYFQSKSRYINHIMTSWAIKHADKIIAISQSTKKDIIEYFNVDPSRISVVYRSYDADKYRPIADADLINKTKQKYGLREQYILYVGTLEPRKNITRLIEAFYEVKKSGNSCKLVICGAKGWMYNDIFELIRRQNLKDGIIFTGYVPEQEMPILMNGAAVLVYPSLYEGFGRPPLEAMACGTPVISSNTSSMPEVVGDAGILIDPNSVSELVDAIEAVLSDGTLRDKMSRKGLDRARLFTTDFIIKNTLSVFNT